MKQPSKIPTWDDYRRSDGAHCRLIWRELTDERRCPGCDRTKFEILRWTRRVAQGTIEKYGMYSWHAAFAKHHDHGRYIAIGMAPGDHFPPTIVCDHCNNVDGAIKQKNKKIHADWSFTPKEIREIVTATPHRGHKIDHDMAEYIYNCRLLFVNPLD